MWPFKRKKSEADLALEWMPQAINVAAQKWLEFQNLPFNHGAPLGDQIFAFSIPLSQGLRQWKAFQGADEPFFLLIAAKGVEKAGTHSGDEIAAALQLPYLPS